MSEVRTFFRVSNTQTNQGLWYSYDGEHTGLIHTKFNFCTNKDLPMPFTPEIVGYLSTADSMEALWHWFSKEDVLKLQDHGYYIHQYESDDYKFHVNHWVINKESCKLIKQIIL